MTVHLVRMAVGVGSLAELAARQSRMLAGAPPGDGSGCLRYRTRNTPKRAAELVDGGSLFWIIKGYIRARQRVMGIEPFTTGDGGRRCVLVLDATLVPTALAPRKPQQGWRYLNPAEAPADLVERAGADERLPLDMADALRELGLL